MTFQICTCIHSGSFFGKQASKTRENRIWLLAKLLCTCDSPGGSCSSTDSDSTVLQWGLGVCISNKLQVITMLPVPLRDMATEQIFYQLQSKLPGCEDKTYLNYRATTSKTDQDSEVTGTRGMGGQKVTRGVEPQVTSCGCNSPIVHPNTFK